MEALTSLATQWSWERPRGVPVPQLNAHSGAQQKLQINSSSNVLPSLDGKKVINKATNQFLQRGRRKDFPPFLEGRLCAFLRPWVSGPEFNSDCSTNICWLCASGPTLPRAWSSPSGERCGFILGLAGPWIIHMKSSNSARPAEEGLQFPCLETYRI